MAFLVAVARAMAVVHSHSVIQVAECEIFTQKYWITA